MGAIPIPRQPETPRLEPPLSLGAVAQTILSDRRLAHRYCLIASGWTPDEPIAVSDEEVAAVRSQLESAARSPATETRRGYPLQ